MNPFITRITAVIAGPQPKFFRSFALAGLTCLVVLVAPAARAAFHLWDINEIYSSADGQVQFIELRGLSDFQNVMGNNVRIRATNSTVVNEFVCNSNLPASTTGGRTCIFGTSNLVSIPGGVIPNYIIPPNFISPALAPGNGGVLFLPSGFPGQNVAAVYSSLPTNGDSAIVRSGGSFIVAPTNSPKNFNNQSNTIVPVKFLSATKANGDFVMSFRTATGVNGSAGPNYAVEYNDPPSSAAWTTLTDLTGDGDTRAVTNSLSAATNRLRLRVLTGRLPLVREGDGLGIVFPRAFASPSPFATDTAGCSRIPQSSSSAHLAIHFAITRSLPQSPRDLCLGENAGRHARPVFLAGATQGSRTDDAGTILSLAAARGLGQSSENST